LPCLGCWSRSEGGESGEKSGESDDEKNDESGESGEKSDDEKNDESGEAVSGESGEAVRR
jgi:hypothetical protein